MNFQAHFHRRWNHLHDSHVRALAWLLDAPDMLAPAAPCWQGLIATLPAGAADQASDWLAALDRAPDALYAWLDVQPFTRLGRYAEKLMSFYFQHQGILAAHGVQVHTAQNETVGEFDFLLWQQETLLHWEFATKFYLFRSSGMANRLPQVSGADYFVGPNLADTLGAKMEKILKRQLALGLHPAAQAVLPQPIATAQALVKGWLFYHADQAVAPASLGLSPGHCRGFWCSVSELAKRDGGAAGRRYAVLPRLHWLAPARLRAEDTLDHSALMHMALAYFATDSMPLMVAVLEESDGCALEAERGFIVPDDWCSRADQRIAGRG